MVDYIADYLDNIRQRRVFPGVSPGYLRAQQPDHAPEDGEPWEKIFGDVERVIMPGVSMVRLMIYCRWDAGWGGVECGGKVMMVILDEP